MDRMFSFFRRSKKEKDNNNGANKDKENKGLTQEKQAVSPILETEGMCKNNLQTQKAEIALHNTSEISVPSGPPEFGLRENASPSSEVTDLFGDNDSKQTNEPEKMSGNSENVNVIPQPISYANVIRRSEPKSSGVKPCGHGTVAISPRIPIVNAKRENSNTPPSSPIFESSKKIFRRGSHDRRDSASADSCKDEKRPPQAVNKATSPTTATVIQETDDPLLKDGLDSVKKNLINQEAKFQSQLNELSKQLAIRDAEANKLRFQMEEVQRDVFAKSAGMDRLQAELQAAHKEADIVRQRIKHLENDLADYRRKNIELNEQLNEKTESQKDYEREANTKIAKLEAVVQELQLKIESLQSQLEKMRQEKECLEQQKEMLLATKEEEKRKLSEALDKAMEQKKEVEKKWNEDFEKLRTINIMKEQQLLDDFEWKLREVQKSCKQRLQDKDRAIEEKLQESYKNAEEKMKEAEDLMQKVEQLRSVEIEVEHLRDLTTDQERAIRQLLDQQEQMKVAEEGLKNEAKRLRTMIEMEKENLQHMQRLHHQELLDKERKLNQTLNQKRTEIAMYWEERLLHECGRLKNELEQLHNEEKHYAMEMVRRDKNDEMEKYKEEWEQKMKEKMKEISVLKRTLSEREEYYREEIMRTQTNTDRDIMELRRLMDKIDMTHHDRFEKLVQEHETELEKINQDTENRVREVELAWQKQVTSLRTELELVKEQMERESQQKIESLIEQHRSELDAQWQNLIDQKSEAIKLVEEEYVTKYKNLEEQFYTQQKSHGQREIELLKTIDSLKNELQSKDSTIDDLQNSVETLEGGVQVLNQEIAHQGDQLIKTRRESDHKIRGLQDTVQKLHDKQENEREAFRLKLMSVQKQSQETIDHLQRKCQCLTKLFEEVRLRYERRESRQEDLNIISDLKQIIAEQEKDMACLNEEKRYFQMRLMALEKQMGDSASIEDDDEAYEDADSRHSFSGDSSPIPNYPPNTLPPPYQQFPGQANPHGSMFSIPPTIPECDDCDE